MIEYDVVRCSDMLKFIELVNEKLRQGWKLQGGFCTGYMVSYYQAIYREKSKFDEKQYYKDMFGEQTDEIWTSTKGYERG